jgi:hypothetical protein
VNLEHCAVNSRFEIRSDLDKNRYEYKEHRKYVRKERIQYIKLLQLESFHQSFRTFALSFNRAQKLHSIVTVYTIFPTNLAYIEKIKYIGKGAAWATLLSNYYP